MPILDYEGGEFTVLGGQAVVATAFTAPAKALGNAAGPARDWGQGAPLRAWARVTQAFNLLTSLLVEVGAADDTAGTNFVPLAGSSFTLAQLFSGALLSIGFLKSGLARKLWLIGKFTVTGTNPSLGRVTLGVAERDAMPQNGFSAF